MHHFFSLLHFPRRHSNSHQFQSILIRYSSVIDSLFYSSFIYVVYLSLISLALTTNAEIIGSGFIHPDNPAFWTSDTVAYIGNTGPGNVTVNGDSDLLSNTGYISLGPYRPGTVTVDGNGSSWTNSTNLFIGYTGDGKLNITNGGLVSSYGSWIGWYMNSRGEVMVDGNGSTWTNSTNLYVGHNGSGKLNITGGGAVSNEFCTIGGGEGTMSEVMVDGEGSAWTSSKDVKIGYGGNGKLNITNGGLVSSYGSWIGYYSMGEVMVDGNGSTWTNSTNLYVGFNASSKLNITGGGAVSNKFCTIGFGGGVMGEVMVDGNGSTWTNSEFLCVGGGGYGTLNITSGGTVITSLGIIGASTGSVGKVSVDGEGSSWKNSTNLYVGYDGSGKLNITGGGLVVVEDLYINNNPGSYINMATGGMLALPGNFSSSLSNFMSQINGPSGSVHFWDDSTSTWCDIMSGTYGDDYTLDFLSEGELTNYTLLTVYTQEKADYDGDGDVDGNDFLVWQRGESPNSGSQYDLNAWKTQFGSIFPDIEIELYSLTKTGDIYEIRHIEADSGASIDVTELITWFVGDLIGMDFCDNGELYALWKGGGIGAVMKIDMLTGFTGLVGGGTSITPSIRIPYAEDIAFSPSGELFALTKDSLGSNTLVKVDPNTGKPLPEPAVSLSGVNSIRSIDFATDGTLFGDGGRGLVYIDPITGYVEEATPGLAIPNGNDLDYGADGILRGIESSIWPDLFTIDSATGNTTVVGPMNTGYVYALASRPISVAYDKDSDVDSAIILGWQGGESVNPQSTQDLIQFVPEPSSLVLGTLVTIITAFTLARYHRKRLS